MAITRSQQAKQMLQDGGMLVKPGFGGTRQGYRGSDMGQEKGTVTGRAANTGIDRDKGSVDRSRTTKEQDANQRNVVREARIREAEKLIDRPNIFEKVNTFNKNFLKARQKNLYNLIPNNPKRELEFLSSLRITDPAKYDTLPQNLKDLLESTDQDFAPSYKDSPKLSFEDFDSLTKFDDGAFAQYAKDRGSPGLSVSGDMSKVGIKSVRRDKFGNPVKDIFGNTLFDYDEPRDDRGGSSILLTQGIESVLPKEEEKKEEEETFTPNLRLLAGGGMAERAPYEGGIMDLESARQMYGLGKLVKKVTRSVKKIAKSPIGKAVIAGAALKFGGPLFAKGGKFNPFFFAGKDPSFAALTMKGALTGIAGISALGGLTAETDDEDQEQYAGADLPFPVDYYLSGQYAPNMRLAAEGGLMRTGYQEGSKEPVAKKTMPLLDMGGMEKDYREEGGFVPIGRMEKADDVPARLSKNEFVFTADAVRNAGDGDVDLGAEKMYNMMKNLEAGGDVSEESQGMDGARKMFQTSQRLEEVI